MNVFETLDEFVNRPTDKWAAEYEWGGDTPMLRPDAKRDDPATIHWLAETRTSRWEGDFASALSLAVDILDVAR